MLSKKKILKIILTSPHLKTQILHNLKTKKDLPTGRPLYYLVKVCDF